jgi:hypothetical protein
MKTNLYNLKLRGTGGEPEGGIGIGGIGIGSPAGEGIGFGDDEAGPSGDIIPDGLMFYNFRIEKIWYFLRCAGGDNLLCSGGAYLKAQNVS